MRKTFVLINYEGRNIIAIDNEVFDWGVDPEEANKVILACKKDAGEKSNYVGNIKNYFITCFSEFVGRPITFREINEALEKGFIEV